MIIHIQVLYMLKSVYILARVQPLLCMHDLYYVEECLQNIWLLRGHVKKQNLHFLG